MSIKYAMLVGDGMADLPIPELQGKTPLAYAHTPNMDRIAVTGVIGRIATIPEGLPPGSDVGNLSLLGYDPARYYSGRAPIEAASMGVPLGPDDTAFRCNLVTIAEGRMLDYSAGHIETNDAWNLSSLSNRNSAALLFGSTAGFRTAISWWRPIFPTVRLHAAPRFYRT